MTLTITQIEQDRKAFYAPAFNVVVGNSSLLDLRIEVASVQVEQMLAGAHRFSFVINNVFDLAQREFIKVDGKTLSDFFQLGTEVRVYMGYGDRGKLDLMVTGLVTEWSTSFPSSSLPQITISGFDHMFPLTKGAESHSWPNQKDSDVVRKIANAYKLTPHIDDTGVVHPRIAQSQETAAHFIYELADRNGFEVFMAGKDLFFRAAAKDKAGDIELVWGRGLVSFSPEINLGDQVTAVEVYGWNPLTKEPIVGRARKGDVPGGDRARQSGVARASGAEYLQKSAKPEQATLRVRQPVFSQQQADRLAYAIMKRHAEGFVGGRGESIGIPELKPNANVTLKGLGDLFSTTFPIRQATHTVDSSGYRTTFEIKDTKI